MAEGKQVVVDLTFNANADNAKKAMKSLMQELNALSNSALKNASTGTLNKDLLTASHTAIQLRQNLETAFNVKTGNLDLVKFNQSMKSAGMSLEQYRTQLMNLGPAGAQSFAQLSTAIMQADAPLTRVNSKLNDFAVSLKNTAKWQISSSILHGLIGSINSAYSYAQNLNASLNDIRIVTGASAEEMSKFASAANKAAKSLSTSTKTYADAALIFYQQGLGDADVKERTDAVIKMANVTKDSAAEVSSYMTAIWNNFDDGSKSLEHYADVMTALGAATASSTAEIADGLEKFASIGKTIGLSYDYATSALATIVSQTRQSADTVGTGLRTIFSRLQGLSLGETLEDGVNLNKYSQALSTVGVQILDASGNMKDMDTILESLAGKWASLSQAQKTALAQTVGGVRQYTTLISLMDNWDSMETNLVTAKGSSGALQEQADIYAESWDAAKDRVRASAEAIYSSLINDEFFISLNNGFAGFLDQISNIIDGLGGLKGVLLTLTPIVTKLFRDQITSGLRNTIVSLQALTPKGRASLKATQQEAIEQTAKMYEDSSTAGGYAMADQYRRTAKVQQSYLDNSRSMSDDDKRLAQEEVSRYNDLFGSRVQKAGEEADKSDKAQDEASEAARQARRKALKKKTADIEKERKAKVAESNKTLDANMQAELDADDVKHTAGESEKTRVAKEEKQRQIREKYKKRKEQAERKINKDTPSAEKLGKNLQAAEADLTKKATAQGFQEKAKEIIQAKVDVDTSDIEGAKKDLQNLIATIRTAAENGEIDLDASGFAAALDQIEAKAKKSETSLQDLRDAASQLQGVTDAAMDATDLAQNGSEDESGPKGYERAALEAGVDEETTKKTSQDLVDTGVEAGASLLEVAVASQEADQAAADLEQRLNNMGNLKVDFASGFTASISAISAVGSAISSVTGLMDVWGDSSASVGEKVLSTIMTLASVAGSLGSAFDSSNVAILKSMATTLAAKLGWFGLSGSMLSTAAAAPVAGAATGAAGGTAAAGGVAAQLGWWPFTLIMLAVVAVVALVVGAFVGLISVAQSLSDAYNADAIAAEKAAETARALGDAYTEAANKYQTMIDTMDQYTSARAALDSLTEGTQAYNDALAEANEAGLALINSTSGLKRGEDYRWENGELIIDQDAMDRVKQEESERVAQTRAASLMADANAATAKAKADRTAFVREDDVSGWAGLGAGAAMGAGYGAMFGPWGAAIGGVLGGIAGLGTALWGNSVDNKAQNEQIDKLAKQYETMGEEAFDEANLEALGFDTANKAYIDSLKEVVEATVAAADQTSNAARLAAQEILATDETYQRMDAEDKDRLGAASGRMYQTYQAEAEAKYLEQAQSRGWFNSGNAESKAAWEKYADITGLDELNGYKVENYAGNGDDARVEYSYIDDEGERQTREVTAQQIAAELAAAEAAEKLGQSTEFLINEFNRLESTTVKTADGLEQKTEQQLKEDQALSDFLAGDMTQSSRSEAMAMANALGGDRNIETSQASSYLGSAFGGEDGILSDEEAKKYGYESAAVMAAAFQEEYNNTMKAWDSIELPGGIGEWGENLSLEAAQSLENTISELNLGPMGEAAGEKFVAGLNTMLAGVKPEDQAAALNALMAIDWSDWDALSQADVVLQKFGVDIDLTSQEWLDFAESMRIAARAVPDFSQLKSNLNSISKILGDLEFGEAIDEDDYNTLVEYNQEWSKFFVTQADGSRKFIGDAEAMTAATRDLALEHKNLLETYSAAAQNDDISSFNWDQKITEETLDQARSDFEALRNGESGAILNPVLEALGYNEDAISAALADPEKMQAMFNAIYEAIDPAYLNQIDAEFKEMVASTATSVAELQQMLSEGVIDDATYSKSLLAMASGYDYCSEAVKNYQEALANGEGIAEAQAILERTVALEQEAAKYGKAYQNAMSGRSSVSIEDLTALQEAAPELYDQFLTMSDAEWVDSAYEHYSAMLEARIASYPKDSAAYREAVMEKRELDEEYYSALEERAESALNSVREHQEGLRDAISGASDALDGLLEGKSFNELGKAEVANLIQSLREVGYSAEEIDRILKNLGKDEEQSSTASMLAAARAKTQLMLAEIGTYKQEQAAYESLGAEGFNATEANTTITVDADVQSPLKTEGDSIVPQTTPGESTIEVSLDSQNATYNPETGDIYVKSADGLITYRFDVDNVAQAFDPDTGLYTLTDPKTGKIIYQFNLNNAPSSFDPDTGKVTILDPETGTIDYQFDIKDLSAAFDPDTGEYTLTDPDTGAIAYAFNINDTVGAFDPEKGTYTLYDSTTGQLKYSFSVTNETAAFDPTTGKYTLTDATTGKIIYTTTVNTNSTTFDPTTGSILITTPEGHTIPYKVEVDNNASTFDAASGKLVVVDADGKKVPYTVDVSNGVYNPATKQIEFTDASGNKVSYSVDGAEGFVYDEATNSFTFANSDGTVNYSVAAASGYVYDKESNTWKFNPSAVTANVGLEGDDLPEDGEERTVTVYVKTVDTSIDEVIASQEALQAAVGKAGYDYWGSLGKTGWFDAGFNNTWNDIVDSKFNVAQYLATHDNGEAELRSMSGAIGKELQRQLEEEFGGDMSAALANESWATGYNLYLGLIKGYQAAGGEAANMVGPVNGALLAQINSDLGVQSPSKYTKETGHWLMAGLVEGFAETPFEATGLAGKVMGAIQDELADVSPGDALKAIEDELFGIDNGTDAEGNPIIRGTELTSEEKANYLAQKGYKIQANEDGTFQAYTIDSEGNVQKAIGEAYETFDQAYLTLVTDMFSEKRMADYLSGGYMTSGDFDAIEQGLIKEALENGFKEWKAKNPDSGFETLDELLQSGDPHVVGDFYDNYFTPAVANGAQTLQDAMSMAYANIQDEWITTLKNVNKATDEAAKQMYDSWMTTFEALSDAYAAIFSGENLSESLSKESQRALIDGWLKEGYTPDEIRDMMLNKDSVSIDDLSMQDYANSGSQQGGAAVGFDYNADGTVKETSYTQWEANMRAHYQRQADQFASTEDMVAADTQAAHKEYLTWMGQGLNFDQILAEKGVTRDKYDSDEAYQAAVKAVQAGMADAQTLADVGFYERNEDGTYVTTDELSEAVKTGYVDAMMAGHGATAAEREQVYLDAYGNLIANDIEYRQGMRDRYSGARDAAVSKLEEDRDLVNKAMNGEALSPEEQARVDALVEQYGSLEDANIGLASTIDQTIAAFNRMIAAIDAGYTNLGDGVWGKKVGDTTVTQHEGQYDTLEAARATGLLTDNWTDADGDGVYSKTMAIQDPETGKYYIVTHTSEMETMSEDSEEFEALAPEGTQYTDNAQLEAAQAAGFADLNEQDTYINEAETRKIVGVNGEEKNLMATESEIIGSEMEGQLAQTVEGWNDLTEAEQNAMAAEKEANLTAEERAELLKEAEKRQRKYANEIKKMEKAYKKLADEGDDLLKTANDEEASMTDRAAAIDGLREIYEGILGPMEDVDDEFVKSAKNMEDAKKAAEGDEEAMNRLQVAYVDALTPDVDFTPELQDLAAEIAAWDPGDLEVGATIDDTDFLAKCVDLVDKCGLTADQASAALSAMGVDAKLVKHEQTTPPTQEEIAASGGIYVPDPATGEKKYIAASGSATIEKTGDKYVWWTLEGATYNGKGVTGGGNGGTGGGGRRRGGGGGGGGGREARRANHVTKDDYVERYHEIDNAIDDLADAYDRLNNQQDRAWGKNRIAAMKEQEGIIKKQIAATEEKIRQAEEYLKLDKEAAEAAGWIFGDDGNVVNYDEFMSAQVDKYNDAIDAYNDMSAKEQEKLDKKYSEMKDEDGNNYSSYEDYLKKTLLDGPKEALEKYEETMELLEDLGMDYDEFLNAWHDNIIGQIQTKLDTTLQVTGAQLEYLEHKLSRIGDYAYGAADAIANIADQMSLAQANYNANMTAIDELLQAYNGDWSVASIMSMTPEQREQFSADLANMDLESGDIELILGAISGMQDAAAQLDEAMISSFQTFEKALQSFDEELARHISEIEHAQTITASYRNILDLTGRSVTGMNAAMIKSINDQVVAQSKSRLSASKTRYESSQTALASAQQVFDEAKAKHEAGEMTDAAFAEAQATYQSAVDMANSAQEEFLSSWEDALQAAADAFVSNMEEAVREVGGMLSGGLAGGLAELEDQFAKLQERDQNYVDDYEKIYQLTKMTRDLNDKIDSTTNVRAQKELLKYQKEINGLLESDQKMSEYDIDYLQKKLDLKMAEIAMDEAQNAKSQVTMRRDSEGNYNYVYTADEDAVAQAESEYADKLYAMQVANDEYITSLSENMANLSSQMMNEIAAIDTTIYDTDEKYQAEVARITEHYSQQMEYYNGEMSKVLGNNKTLYEEDWTNFSKYTGYKLSAEKDYVTNWNQTILSQVTGFETQEGFYQNFNKAIFGDDPTKPSSDSLIGRLVEAYKAMRQQIQQANEAAGYDTESLATALVGNIGTATTQAETAAQSITTSAQNIATAIGQMTTGIGDAMDEYCDAMSAMVESTDVLLDALLDFLSIAGDIGDLEIDEGILAEIRRRKEERENQGNPASMDTGGYTGSWGSDGRVAILHQKELVLNAEDTANMLASVGILRQIASVIDLNALASAGGFGNLVAGSIGGHKEVLQQEVHIEAHFPNATDKNQIEEAFKDIVNLAAQYSNRM